MIFSILVVYSSSAFYAEYKFGDFDIVFWKHLRNVLLSLGLMLVFSAINYKFLLKITKFLLFSSFILLVLALLFSLPIKGATRWIDLGIANFQPSELAKFALIVYISKLLTERSKLKDEFLFVPFPIFLWIFIFCLLIALQPNFSNAIIILVISIILLFIGKIKFKYILRFTIIMILLGSIYGISESYRLKRITGFIDFITAKSTNNVTYQSNQALISIGTGGIFGLGPGKSQQSKLFLPESYGDYIFSIIGEEYGFIGLLFVLILFVIVVFRIFLIAKNCQDPFAFFLATGILITISFYAIVNSFVNIGFLPTTGLPMPFISYGGSSIIFYGIAIGIIQNIYSNIKSGEYE